MSVADTTSFYGRWARAYDWLCRLLPGLDDLRSAAADALALEPGDVVVDVGCGTGANLSHLHERVGPSGAVVGVDLTPEMLAAAGARVERAGWQNVHLARGDAARPPVRDVDAVLGTFVVGMLPDPGGAVDRWTDCLTPGGRVAVLEASRTDHAVGRRLNRVFDALVAAGAPTNDHDAPGRALDDRVDAARDALAANAALTCEQRRVGGFVRLFAGERPAAGGRTES